MPSDAFTMDNNHSDGSEVSAQAPDGIVGISADEIALYDRQIRLWGVRAQEKIQSANILLIKTRALANEVAKNLVLAGVGSLTLVDHEDVSESDLGAQFLISEDCIGYKRAEVAADSLRKLNSRVTVRAITDVAEDLNEDFVEQFDVVISTNTSYKKLTAMNAVTRSKGKRFYAAGTHGLYGYIFADLITHEYIIEREQPNIPTSAGPESKTRSIIGVSSKRENGIPIEIVTKREVYSEFVLANKSQLPVSISSNRRKLRQVSHLLPAFRALWEMEQTLGQIDTFPAENAAMAQFVTLATEKWRDLNLTGDEMSSEFLAKFLDCVGVEVSPVAAFLGGQLAQDVINVLGQREQPIQNFLFFDGEEMKGPIYPLHPH